jgi:protein subunit release factor A
VEEIAKSTALQYGLLGVFVFVFAYVILALYKRSEAKDDKITADRVAWAAKEQSLRAEYEAKHVAALVEYARQLQALRESAQEREDMIRKEFSDVVDRMADEATKTAQSNTEVLNKVYERFLMPRR